MTDADVDDEPGFRRRKVSRAALTTATFMRGATAQSRSTSLRHSPSVPPLRLLPLQSAVSAVFSDADVPTVPSVSAPHPPRKSVGGRRVQGAVQPATRASNRNSPAASSRGAPPRGPSRGSNLKFIGRRPTGTPWVLAPLTPFGPSPNPVGRRPILWAVAPPQSRPTPVRGAAA